MAYIHVFRYSEVGISTHEWAHLYWILSNTRGKILKERRDVLLQRWRNTETALVSRTARIRRYYGEWGKHPLC